MDQLAEIRRGGRASILIVPTRLSAWQQRLKADLLREELLQDVLTHPQTARTIARLRAASVVDAFDDRMDGLRLPLVAAPEPCKGSAHS